MGAHFGGVTAYGRIRKSERKMEEEMAKIVRGLGLVLLVGVWGLSTGAEDLKETATVLKGRDRRIEFISYAGLGGGAGLTTSWDGFPVLDASAGIQILPWLSLGGFGSAAALSDFDDAPLGASIADRENAYAVASGAEVLMTPWSARVVHPVVRITVGGTSVGYLEDQDGDKGMETAIDERFFYTSASAGAELNLSKHIRFSAQAGTRFIPNTQTLGIATAGLSGMDLRLGFRLLWRTVFN
jgi:hypothetical protein